MLAATSTSALIRGPKNVSGSATAHPNLTATDTQPAKVRNSKKRTTERILAIPMAAPYTLSVICLDLGGANASQIERDEHLSSKDC